MFWFTFLRWPQPFRKLSHFQNALISHRGRSHILTLGFQLQNSSFLWVFPFSICLPEISPELVFFSTPIKCIACPSLMLWRKCCQAHRFNFWAHRKTFGYKCSVLGFLWQNDNCLLLQLLQNQQRKTLLRRVFVAKCLQFI